MQRLQGMTGLNNPVEIQLQYLPDDVLLARACITPASPTEENRNLALPARLQDFSTSPAHHRKKAKVKVSKLQNKNCQHQKGFCTKSSNDLSKNHVVVLVEDLCIRNMSKSERGSQENQGKIVEQTSGLNGETRRKSLPSGPSESEGSQEMAETPAVLSTESPSLPPPVDRSRRYPRILLLLFLCTLPLVNPIVHGDGVGYYANVRAPLIEHSFRLDYQHANPNSRDQRVDGSGQPDP